MGDMDDVIVEVRLPKSAWERIVERMSDDDPVTEELADAFRAAALRSVGRIDQMQAEIQEGE